jgi:hypothetical protein
MAGRGNETAHGGARLRPWAVLPALLFGTVFICGWEVSPAHAVIVPCKTCPAGYFPDGPGCTNPTTGDEITFCPAALPKDLLKNMKLYDLVEQRSRIGDEIRSIKQRIEGAGGIFGALWGPDNPFAALSELQSLANQLKDVDRQISNRSNYSAIGPVRVPSEIH